jgi:CRP/FNR family transcriptional regulator
MPVSIEAARSIPYFKELAAEDLARIREAVSEQAFGRGDFVQHEGDDCRAMYWIREGRVRIFKTSSEGKVQVLKVMGPGDTFNEVPVFDGGPNPASAQTVEATTLYVIGGEALRRVIRERPAVALALLAAFARKLRHFTRLVEELSFKTVTARLANILLGLTPEEGRAGGPPARMSQQDLAAMAGTAREMVGRALKAFEREGAIRIERQRIVVLDPDLLRKHL